MPYRKQKINNIYISSRPKWKENTSAELLNYCYTISMTKSNCKSIQSILSTYYDICIVHYPSCVYAMTNQCFFFFLSSISPAELYQSIYLSYIWQPDLICLLSASSGSQVKCCLAINNCDTDNLVPPDTGISICSCLPHRTSTFYSLFTWLS